MPQLSVVTPMYNEREAVDHFVARLRPVLDGLGVDYEVVAVDDGSADATVARLLDLRRDWPALRVVALRRNVGHQTALAAGLRAASGDYVVSIDADLQDPPEVIGEMLAVARDRRADVVYGVRTDRTADTWFKRSTARLYYWVMRRLVGPWVSDNAGDFRLMSRAVVDVLNGLAEQRPVYRLVVPSLGFVSAEVPYVRAERVAGVTKYPLSKMIKLTADSVTGFSAAPLKMATWLGLFSFVLCVVLTTAGLVAWVAGAVVPGWTSLYVAVLLLGGVQLICLGLLGEYIGRIYAATQNRPRFLVAFDTGDLLAGSASAPGAVGVPAPVSQQGPVAVSAAVHAPVSGPGPGSAAGVLPSGSVPEAGSDPVGPRRVGAEIRVHLEAEARASAASEARAGVAGEARSGVAGEVRAGVAGEARSGVAGEVRAGVAGEARAGAAGEARSGVAGEARAGVVHEARAGVVHEAGVRRAGSTSGPRAVRLDGGEERRRIVRNKSLFS